MKLRLALLVLTFNESIGFSPTKSRPTFGIHSKSFQLNSFTNSYLDSLSSSAKSAIDNLESKLPKNAIENVEESFSSSATHLIGDVKNSLSSSARHLIDDMDIPPIPSSTKNIVGNMESSIPTSAKHAVENYSSHDMQKLLDSITTTTKSITTSRFSLDPALIDAKVLAASKFLEDMLPPAMQELKTKKYDFSNYLDEDGKSKIQVRSDSYFDADGNVVQSRFANVDEKSATPNDTPESVQIEENAYEEMQLDGNGDGQSMKDIGNNEMQIDSSDVEIVQQASEDPVVKDSYSIQTVDSDVEILTQTPATDGDNLNIEMEETGPTVTEFEPENIQNNLNLQGQEMTQIEVESITDEDVMSAEELTTEKEHATPNTDVSIEETSSDDIVESIQETDTTPDVDGSSVETQFEPAEVDQADTLNVEDTMQAPVQEDGINSEDIVQGGDERVIDTDPITIEEQTELSHTDDVTQNPSVDDVSEIGHDGDTYVNSLDTETQIRASVVEENSDLPEYEESPIRILSEDSDVGSPLLSNEGDNGQQLQSEGAVDQTVNEVESDVNTMSVDEKSMDDIFQMEQSPEEPVIDSDPGNTGASIDTHAESSVSTVDGQFQIPDVEPISQESQPENFFHSPEGPAIEYELDPLDIDDSIAELDKRLAELQAEQDELERMAKQLVSQMKENLNLDTNSMEMFASDTASSESTGATKIVNAIYNQDNTITVSHSSTTSTLDANSIAELDKRLAELQAEQDELERMAKQLVSQMKENLNLDTNSMEMFASDTTSSESTGATKIMNAIYNQDNTVTVSHSSTTSTLDANFEHMKQNFQNMFQEFEAGNPIIDSNAAPVLERATDVTTLVASEAIVTGFKNEELSEGIDDNIVNDASDDIFSRESSSVNEVVSSSAAPDTSNEVELVVDTVQQTTSAGQTSTPQKSATVESSQSNFVENSAIENSDADMNGNIETDSRFNNIDVSEVGETTSTDAVASLSTLDTSIDEESSRAISVQDDSTIAPIEEFRASTESQITDKNPIENVFTDTKADLETNTEITDNIVKVGKQASQKIDDFKLPEAGEKIGNAVGKIRSKANKMEYDFSIDTGVQDQIPNAESLKRIKLSEVMENSNKALTPIKDKFQSAQGKVFKPFEEMEEKINAFKAKNNAAFDLDQKVESIKSNKISEGADRSFIGPLKEKIQSSLQSTPEQDLAKQVEGALSNNLKQVEGTLAGNLKQVEGTLAGNLKQVEGTLSNNVNQLEGTLSSNLKQVEKAVETNIKQVEGAISDDVTVLNSKSSEILGKVADSELVQQTTKVTKEVADSEVVKVGVKVAKDVGTTSAKAISTAVESEAVQGVTASLRNTADSITIRDIDNAFIAAIKFIGVLVLKILDSILETCNQESVAELFEDTRGAISDTATSIGKTLNEFTINGFDGESFADVLRDIAGIVVQFTTAIGAIVTNILDIILEQSGANENASELIHHIQDSFVSLFQNIGDTSILEVIENIVGLVVAVANVIVNLLSTGKDTVYAAVTINGDVGSGTDNLATLIESVGTEIVSSIDSINIPL